MKFSKLIVILFLFISFSKLVSAEVRTFPSEEKLAAGTFSVSLPKPMLRTSIARQTASFAIEEIINQFRYQAQKIGNTQVRYYVTADNDSYVSLLFDAAVTLPDTTDQEKESHSVVIDKQTGKPLALENFLKPVSLKIIQEKAEKGQVKVYSSDGQTELDPALVENLSAIPTEFILDREGNIFLLATEITVFSTGTPLIALPNKYFSELYVVKG